MNRMALLTKEGPRSFPVERCPGRSGTRAAMRMHFFNRHVQDIVIILIRGTSPNHGAPDAT